jgi:DNA-binding XRE family transcriptional regulator
MAERPSKVKKAEGDAAAGVGSNSLVRYREAAEESYDILSVVQADLNLVMGRDEWLPGGMVKRRLVDRENPVILWREHRGMTQKALAAKVKMTAAQLSEIENGKKSGSIKTLQKLAKALGVSVDDLLPPLD